MRWFAGRSAHDRDHLSQTVRSLGTSSLAGLSAALSWSPRRTERALSEAIASSGGRLRYDPVRRSVTWVAPDRAAPDAAPRPPAAPPTSSPPPPAPSVPALPKSWGASAKCPNCEVAFLPTGTGNHLYCPECGRLASARRAASTQSPAPSTPAVPSSNSPTGTSGSTALTLGADRRSQELFAAWVTSQPIPCPKCRTPLRHHGVAEYACPGCGTRIAFERSSALPNRAPAPAPTAPPAPPAA